MFDITFLENALAFNCGVTQREREREMNYSELFLIVSQTYFE